MNRVNTDLLVYLSKGRDTLDHDPTFMAWKSTATNLSNLLVLTFFNAFPPLNMWSMFSVFS